MSEKRDYYDVLGAERGADPATLKRAYRKLAMQYHPDRNHDDPDAEKKFKELNEAYEVLKDDEKRAAYDRFGHAAFEQGGGGHPGGFDFPFGGGGFADIFEEMFGNFAGGGGGRTRSGGMRGADIRFDLDISLEEAFSGVKKTIEVETSVSCDSCSGTGSEGGKAPDTCSTCGGVGRVRAQQGFFTIERGCPTCRGTGQIIREKCKKCTGTGRKLERTKIDVTIPAGIEDGTRLRLSGKGEAGRNGGPAGDLYVFLTVRIHKLFTRKGPNLYCQMPMPMVKACLGGEMDVPTIEGKQVQITAPAGTQTDHQFRLKGKGMPVMRTENRGDLFVVARVETPVKLTKKQKQLLKDFEADNPNYSPENANFMEKVKDVFKNLTGQDG